MGVIGLWGLLEPAGKPVPLESLENKILAVDVSIWLNQAVKGYRDKSGNTVTNAHLLGLFHRVSKLLFYKIKPVFVFDGKAPDLKKETLQRRRIRKGDASKKARVASVKILDNYVRSQAVAAQLKQQTHAMNKVLAKGQEGLHQVLNDRTQKKDKDLFELPPLQPDQGEHAVFEEDSDSDDGLKEDLLRQLNATDIHNMDVSSQQFKLLPKDLQYEILSDLTERRKQSSWSRMHEMPKSSGGFSNFQMQRLVNRSRVQKAKDNVGKEIGEENTLHVDANLFVGDVQGLKRAKAEAKRVASSASGTHYLFVKNLKQLNASADTVVKEDSNEVEILEPSSSVQMSNRSGGTFAIKQEALDDDESEDIFQDEILRVIQSEAQLGKSNARDPEPCSSKSTAVFESSSSDESDCFEEVASEDQPIPGLSLSIEINPDMKADDDMFADVFNEPPSADVPSEDDPIANMAEKMKKSDHLYLKIASKYVEPVEEVPPSSSGAQKEPDEDVFDDLDQETDKLIAEMRTQSKEERLLKIKDLDKLQAEEPKSKKVKESAPSSSKEDKRVLDQLGVESIEQSAYQSSVEKEAFKSSQPLIDDNKDDVVYGDAVAGFVRSSADAHIQNLDNSKGSSLNETILEKLDTEGEEFSRNELLELQNKLAEEHEGLIAERGQLDRLAATITDQMYAECQELLQLFGIPWIVAPSEAEAQCAFLDMNNLTHGTITDDSDIWVFGGQRTYKNFFNQDKHCEFFSAADVAKHFGLSREKLILLALMTGSDYTDGIETVGPVTGLEILAEFAGEGLEPLRKFKSWWDDAHRNLAMPPGSKLREKLRKLQLTDNFPSERISQAYMNPEIDNSLEKFSWAIPNFVAIRDYASEKFGWSGGKIDEIIKPVIKKMSVKINQERIDNFFLASRIVLPEKGQYQSSRRVKDAIDKVLGKSGQADNGKAGKKRKIVEAKRKEPAKKATTEKASKDSEEPKSAVVLPPKDWKREEELKQQEAKRKALEVLKKIKSEKAKKAKKGKTHTVQRRVLSNHNLSESDSD